MQEVIDVFENLHIEYKLIRHPAVFSKADDYKVKDIDFGGVICKNLFVKDKKANKFYLVSLPKDKRANLKKISDEIGCARFSFGNDEELWKKLHIKRASVRISSAVCVKTRKEA